MRLTTVCRSREGAWIEIRIYLEEIKDNQSRSREGAWIEISKAASGEW